jgi:hypothetical protein
MSKRFGICAALSFSLVGFLGCIETTSDSSGASSDYGQSVSTVEFCQDDQCADATKTCVVPFISGWGAGNVCCPGDRCGYVRNGAPECVVQGEPKGDLICSEGPDGGPQWKVQDGSSCRDEAPCASTCVETLTHGADTGAVCCPSDQCGYVYNGKNECVAAKQFRVAGTYRHNYRCVSDEATKRTFWRDFGPAW